MTLEQKFKAIVFDYGGVIELSDFGSIHDAIIAELGVTKAEFQAVYFQYNYLSNTGQTTFLEMLQTVARQFSDTDETAQMVQTLYLKRAASYYLNEELLELIRSLRASGYTTAILSNYTTELRGRLAQQGIDKLFDEIVISGEVGHQKPSSEIFTHLFGALEVEASEVIFIDDTPRSLETAPEIGYTPIRFTDNAELVTELTALGVL